MPSKSTNAFADFDVTKVWKDFKFPAVGIDVFVAAQQKNLDTLSQMNKLAYEGLQTVATRQAEIMRDAFEKTAEVTRQIASLQDPSDRLVKQSDYAKSAFAAGIAQQRELAELWTKAANQTVDLVSKRFAEGLDEFKGIAQANGAAEAHPAPAAKA